MKILLDMDGVLCDFVGRLYEAFGMETERPAEWEWGYHDLHEAFGLDDPHDMWSAVDEIGVEFWAGIEPMPWLDDLLSVARKYGTSGVYICTTPSRNGSSASGKVAWMQEHLGEDFRDWVLTPRKHLLADEDTLLIDDHGENVDKFIAEGGMGVLFPAQWNCLGWKRNPVAYVRKPVRDYFMLWKLGGRNGR